MIKKKKICIDFDGVLAKYDGWKGKQHHGAPFSGVKTFLKKLDSADIDFVVLTTRESKKHIINWFKKYKLPMPLDVTNKKIMASAYIDDRAVNFDGDFRKLLKTLSKFKVHWKNEKEFEKLN